MAAIRACRVLVVQARRGLADLPVLPEGRPANLGLLEDVERDVVEEADARAARLRTRNLVVHVAGRRRKPVRITQTRHAFPFGFAVDTRDFANAPDDLEFFERITRDHFDVAVLSSNAKWARVEPYPPGLGPRQYQHVDNDVDWALDQGFEVKGHTLMWGIVPPFSTSGVPSWLIDRFGVVPDKLSASEKEELSELLRNHIFDLVQRYKGDVASWDVTNETLQPLAQWFVVALGPKVIKDVFHWAHEADPTATLVFNEWIGEVFTGLPFAGAPTAVDVRNRVLRLLNAGTPIDVLGQQAHFAPAIAFFAPGLADLSQRTRLDEYAQALDTLAQTGLPIHITEVNFIAPDDPERRAAQAEGLMRIWWGHPAVEQIVFWGSWNKVAGRREFNVGLWDDNGIPSRHGEAVLALLNERWRTDVWRRTGRKGVLRLRAGHGDYVIQWSEKGHPVYAEFEVEPGIDAVRIVVVPPPRRDPH